jgi:hypothetical protein
MGITVDRDKLYDILLLLREAKKMPHFLNSYSKVVGASDIVCGMLEQAIGNEPYISPEVIREMIMSGENMEWLRQATTAYNERNRAETDRVDKK